MSVPNPATTNWVPLQGRPSGVAYFGQYQASGHTYYDGDCVIGSDGVLYMCTIDGTTTPPVAWPGAAAPQGVAGPQGPQGVGIPMPVTNGYWIKGVGGAAVWVNPVAEIGSLVQALGSTGGMLGPWPKSWTVTLAFKADLTLTVSASYYVTAGGITGFVVKWDGVTQPVYGDMYNNETGSHRYTTANNVIRAAAAGSHTITVDYSPSGNVTSDIGDRASFNAIAVAVP